MNSALTDVSVEEAWHNIADLKLKLGYSVKFYQHIYRSKPWLIIADDSNENYFRCNSENKYFLELLDGSRSVEQAFQEAQKIDGILLAKQDVVLLIANLKSFKLLQPQSVDLAEMTSTASNKSIKKPWLRPFSIKIALFDPDSFLNKYQHLIKPLFSKGAFLAWVAILLIALTTAWLHAGELLEHSQMRFADPKNFLWYWLLYPAVKVLHELGHAFATKVWGGAVHEMGIMLLVFFPVPYVNSSAAHRFSSKNRRLLVSAAGIMVELLLASLALLVWVNTDAGMLHDMAFDIIIIGGVSTLVFNANPLLRFDGYYIVQEMLEIPNLATRSNQYLAYLFKRYGLNIAESRSPVSALGEEKWMFFYAIFSTLYRFLISLFIAFWVAGKFFIIGIVLAIWALVSQIIYPLFKGLFGFVLLARDENKLQRLGLIVVFLSLVLMGSLFVPIAHSTYAEGLVNLPENAYIRAEVDGIVSDVLISDGVDVVKGTTIVTLDNMELMAQREVLGAKLDEAIARQKNAFLQDKIQADILKARVSTIRAELQQLVLQINNLNLVSETDGSVFLPRSDDLLGRFIKRGEIVGYVADFKQVTAQVVINQSSIDSVSNDLLAIEAIFKSRPNEKLKAQLLRELPKMNERLPNRLLGSGAGGHVAVDARDGAGLQVVSNIFQLEIALPKRNVGNYVGQRIYLRFIHSRESLFNQLLSKVEFLLIDKSLI